VICVCLITTRDEINPCSDKEGSSSNDVVSDDDACVLNYGSKGNKMGWRRIT